MASLPRTTNAFFPRTRETDRASLIHVIWIDLVPSSPHGTSDQPGGPELLNVEAERWGRKYKSMLPDERPSSYAAALKACDAHSFPNIHVLLRIACTLSVTSCE